MIRVGRNLNRSVSTFVFLARVHFEMEQLVNCTNVADVAGDVEHRQLLQRFQLRDRRESLELCQGHPVREAIGKDDLIVKPFLPRAGQVYHLDARDPATGAQRQEDVVAFLRLDAGLNEKLEERDAAVRVFVKTLRELVDHGLGLGGMHGTTKPTNVKRDQHTPSTHTQAHTFTHTQSTQSTPLA